VESCDALFSRQMCSSYKLADNLWLDKWLWIHYLSLHRVKFEIPSPRVQYKTIRVMRSSLCVLWHLYVSLSSCDVSSVYSNLFDFVLVISCIYRLKWKVWVRIFGVGSHYCAPSAFFLSNPKLIVNHSQCIVD